MEEIEKLYKETGKKYIAIVRKILRGRHQNDYFTSAEDVLQEAYVRAITYYPTYDEKYGKLENWFARILFNELSRHSRKEKSNRCENIDRFRNLEAIDYIYLIENTFAIKQSIKLVGNENHRKVLEMLYLQGYLVREISETLKISKTSIRKIIRSFKFKLKEDSFNG